MSDNRKLICPECGGEIEEDEILTRFDIGEITSSKILTYCPICWKPIYVSGEIILEIRKVGEK